MQRSCDDVCALGLLRSSSEGDNHKRSDSDLSMMFSSSSSYFPSARWGTSTTYARKLGAQTTESNKDSIQLVFQRSNVCSTCFIMTMRVAVLCSVLPCLKMQVQSPHPLIQPLRPHLHHLTTPRRPSMPICGRRRQRMLPGPPRPRPRPLLTRRPRPIPRRPLRTVNCRHQPPRPHHIIPTPIPISATITLTPPNAVTRAHSRRTNNLGRMLLRL